MAAEHLRASLPAQIKIAVVAEERQLLSSSHVVQQQGACRTPFINRCACSLRVKMTYIYFFLPGIVLALPFRVREFVLVL